MIVEISKNADKEIEKTPTYIQLKVAEQVEKLITTTKQKKWMLEDLSIEKTFTRSTICHGDR